MWLLTYITYIQKAKSLMKISFGKDYIFGTFDIPRTYLANSWRIVLYIRVVMYPWTLFLMNYVCDVNVSDVTHIWQECVTIYT